MVRCLVCSSLVRIVMQELNHLDKLKQVGVHLLKPPSNELISNSSFCLTLQLPENCALQSLVGGMLKAWELYNQPRFHPIF